MENPKLWAALPAADESVDVPASDKEEAREEPRLLRIPVKLSDNFIPGNSNLKLIIGQLDLTILLQSIVIRYKVYEKNSTQELG